MYTRRYTKHNRRGNKLSQSTEQKRNIIQHGRDKKKKTIPIVLRFILYSTVVVRVVFSSVFVSSCNVHMFMLLFILFCCSSR